MRGKRSQDLSRSTLGPNLSPKQLRRHLRPQTSLRATQLTGIRLPNSIPTSPQPNAPATLHPSLALNIDPAPGPLLAHLTPPPASRRAPLHSCSSYRPSQLTHTTRSKLLPHITPSPHLHLIQPQYHPPVRHPVAGPPHLSQAQTQSTNSPRAWPVLNSGAPTHRQQRHPTCISSSPRSLASLAARPRLRTPCDESPALYQIQTQGPTPSCIKNRPGFPLACS